MSSMLRSLSFLSRRAGSFRRGREGGMLIEFAFALPILVTLILGTVNTAIYILLHQRMDRASSTVADLVSQPDNITQADIDLAFDAANHLFGDLFEFDVKGHGIVTSVTGGPSDDPTPIINFQVHKDCDTANHTSEIGTTPGTPATLPNGLTLQPGESVIISEIYFEYEPMFFGDIIEGGTQYHTAFRRPRLGSGVLAGGSTCGT